MGKDGDCGQVDLKRDKGMVIILSSSGESSRLVFVVNSYRHRTNDLLMESSKTNYERTTGQLTI